MAKVLELQFQHQYSRLISFRIDWFDLLAVQRALKSPKSLLQHLCSKASILQHSTFFMAQLAHPYVIIRKTIALTVWIFVGKVTSLLFNTLSRFVIAFLTRSKHLLISWLWSWSTVILELRKRKFVTASIFSPHLLTWSDGPGCHGLSFLSVEL